jgi:hypothetical protein
MILNSVFQTGGLLRVYAQTRFLLAINILQLLVIGSLITLFIRGFGLSGVVWVTLLSAAIARIVTLSRVKRFLRVSLASVLPWRILASLGAIAVAAALVPLAIRQALVLRPLLFLTIAVLSYGMVYLSLLLRFGLLTTGDLSVLTRWFRQLARPLPTLAEPGLGDRGNG